MKADRIERPFFKQLLEHIALRKGRDGVREFLRFMERGPHEIERKAVGVGDNLYIGGMRLRYIGPKTYPHLLPLFNHFRMLLRKDERRGGKVVVEEWWLDGEGIRKIANRLVESGIIKRKGLMRNKGPAQLLPLPLVDETRADIVEGELWRAIGPLPTVRRCLFTGWRATKHHIVPYSAIKEIRQRLSKDEREVLNIANYLLRVPLAAKVHNKGGWNVERVVDEFFDAYTTLSALDLYIVILNLYLLEESLYSHMLAELRERGVFTERGIAHNLNKERAFDNFLSRWHERVKVLYNPFTM